MAKKRQVQAQAFKASKRGSSWEEKIIHITHVLNKYSRTDVLSTFILDCVFDLVMFR